MNILITGKMGTGKTTLANALAKYYQESKLKVTVVDVPGISLMSLLDTEFVDWVALKDKLTDASTLLSIPSTKETKRDTERHLIVTSQLPFDMSDEGNHKIVGYFDYHYYLTECRKEEKYE